MATAAATPNGEALPPYLSLTTFKWAVQSLRTHGLPEQLDRSAWQSRSGTEQGQIIGAFKFLGLIDKNDRTQPSLKGLTEAPEGSGAEKELLAQLLKAKYLKLFDLDLETATPAQVAGAIGSYGPTGATRDRAVRFFLKAAHFCGIPMSSRLAGGMRSRAVSDSETAGDESRPATAQTTPPRSRRRRRPAAQDTAEPPDESSTGKAVKTVTLRGVSGTLTLSGTFNPFELDDEERKLVYAITDLMKAYAQKTGAANE